MPILLKTIERVIKTIIMNGNELFSSSQYGFKADRSTTRIVSDLVLTVMNGFDCFPHQEFIAKLKHYSFLKDLVTIVTSFLSNKTQIVDINGRRSRTGIVPSVAPQGSILGPVLFKIYINDLQDITNIKINLYADDSSFLQVGDGQEEEKLLSTIKAWMTKNKLKLNEDKTRKLQYSFKNS